MLSIPWGEITRTSWPSRVSVSTVALRVVTTPLVCGDQAAVAIATLKLKGSRGVGEKLGRGPAGCLGAVRPTQQLQLAVRLLNQGGTGLNPVARVAVEGAV